MTLRLSGCFSGLWNGWWLPELTCCAAAGTFALAYNNGGPVMVWSNWILTAGMNLAVAMCLAEISSAMPVAGGPYYW